MTHEELKRYEQGTKILMDIGAYKNKIASLQSEGDIQHIVEQFQYMIDEDLVRVTVAHQIARYKLLIEELQKQFDEL